MFNLGFWLTIPVFLLIGSIPSLIGGTITYLINKDAEESERLEKSIIIVLILLPLFSCGICNYFWSR
jgi:hypothetical protein